MCKKVGLVRTCAPPLTSRGVIRVQRGGCGGPRHTDARRESTASLVVWMLCRIASRWRTRYSKLYFCI